MLAIGLLVVGIVFGYYVALPRRGHLPDELRRGALQHPDPRAATTSRSRHGAGRDGASSSSCPLFVVGLTRLGRARPRDCGANRRLGYFAVACVAVALPGVDPVTTMFETVPLDRPLRALDLALGAARPAQRRGARPRDTADVGPPRFGASRPSGCVPVDGPPLEGGLVAWEDGRIVEVGRGRAATHFDERGDPARVRQRALAPRVRGLRRVRRRPAVRRLARRRTSRASALLAYDEMLAIARRGAADCLALGDHDDCRLQLLGRRGLRRAPSSGCARSSTSRCSASDPAEAERQFAETRSRVRETDARARSGSRPTRRTRARVEVVPLVPLARRSRSGRTSPRARTRTSGWRTGRGRSRSTGTSSSSRPAGAPSRRSRTSSGLISSARTASRWTTTRSRCSPIATFPSHTARGRTRSSAAGRRRSPRCAPRGCASASERTRRRRRRRSTCWRSFAPPSTRRARASGGRTRSTRSRCAAPRDARRGARARTRQRGRYA